MLKYSQQQKNKCFLAKNKVAYLELCNLAGFWGALQGFCFKKEVKV